MAEVIIRTGAPPPQPPSLRRRALRLLSTLAAASALALSLALSGCDVVLNAPREGVVADGLASPRGLTALDDGRLLVAEVGAGRLLLMDHDGDFEVHADLLPRLADGPEGAPAGVVAALMDGDVTYFIVGEARAKGFREVYALTDGDAPRALTGQDVMATAPPNPLTNPYDLLQLPSGDLLVSDAGANVVWRVTLEGEISLYAEPGPIAYVAVDGAAGEAEPVPTGMARGPDGSVFLATLTGYPFPPGASAVFRLLDRNGDGDALDPGETTVHASGFSAATDVAFLEDGGLLVTEYSGDMLALAEAGFARSAEWPGRLVRSRGGRVEVLAAGLVSPTGVAVLEGMVYVSEEFAGRVRAVEP